jgi:hypothetical protein
VIRYAIGRKVPGSRPSEVIEFCQFTALGPDFNRPLTEFSTRDKNKKMLLTTRAQPVRESDNLTAICEPIA